jgi:hypothetical protein
MNSAGKAEYETSRDEQLAIAQGTFWAVRSLPELLGQATRSATPRGGVAEAAEGRETTTVAGAAGGRSQSFGLLIVPAPWETSTAQIQIPKVNTFRKSASISLFRQIKPA